jgi:regulator of protease activity HflC (stomatin/prohibitin superfamily)
MSVTDDSVDTLLVEPPPPAPSPSWRGPHGVAARLHRWVTDNVMMASITVLILAFMLVFFWHKMVVTIPVGHEAVIWRRLSGTDLTKVFPEGTQLVWPWNIMTVYDLRLQRLDLTIPVLSTDGLEIPIAVSVRYHPDAKTLPLLHTTVGPDYAQRIVIPEVTTAVREVMGQYRPQQLYTIRTTEMESRIIERTAKQTRDRFVTVDDVLIARISLPPVVQAAIQMKLKQEQEAEEYEYRLQKELSEKIRKTTEAEGIRDYLNIVQSAATMPENTLRWRGIEATLELAKSPNAKVVVIGGRDGLPIILDTSGIAGTTGGTAAAAAAGRGGRGQ